MMKHPNTMSVSWLAALFGVVLGAFTLGAGAERSPGPQRQLAALNGVAVAIDPFSDAFARNGVTANRIQSYLGERLQAAGIPTHDATAFDGSDGIGLLTLSLRANPDGTRFYSYGWTLTVADAETVGAGGFVTRELWSDGRVGVVVPHETEAMLAELDGLVSAFIESYAQQH